MSKNQSGPNANLPESCSTSNMIAYKRWWRARRKASGVCTTCGGERDSARHVRCSRCRDAEYTAYHSLPEETKATKLGKMNEQVRIKRAGWEAEGLCNWYGAARDVAGRKRCAKCREKIRATNHRMRNERRSKGLCGRCGGIPLKGMTCEKCLGRESRQFKKQYAQNPVPFRNRYHRRRTTLKNSGSYTQAEWEAIKAVQGFRCLKCGKQEPEITLHTDHIVPVSRNGRNTADNLQGLCEHCNKSKSAKHIDYRPVGFWDAVQKHIADNGTM